MSQVTVSMALEVGQAKTRRTNLNKFTPGPVRGGKFVYKLTEQVINTTLIATVFFLINFWILYS